MPSLPRPPTRPARGADRGAEPRADRPAPVHPRPGGRHRGGADLRRHRGSTRAAGDPRLPHRGHRHRAVHAGLRRRRGGDHRARRPRRRPPPVRARHRVHAPRAPGGCAGRGPGRLAPDRDHPRRRHDPAHRARHRPAGCAGHRRVPVDLVDPRRHQAAHRPGRARRAPRPRGDRLGDRPGPGHDRVHRRAATAGRRRRGRSPAPRPGQGGAVPRARLPRRDPGHAVDPADGVAAGLERAVPAGRRRDRAPHRVRLERGVRAVAGARRVRRRDHRLGVGRLLPGRRRGHPVPRPVRGPVLRVGRDARRSRGAPGVGADSSRCSC